MGSEAKVVRIDRDAKNKKKNEDKKITNSIFDLPSAPKFLKGTAKKHFAELVESLGRKHKIINDLDADILSMYCSTYARWLSADKNLEQAGLTQETPNGYTQMSPEYIIWRDLTGQCLKIAKQLGLTPPSRFQMKVSATEDQEAFDFM